MTDLVMMNSNINELPFTTSEIIADMTKNSYRSVQRLIENYQSDFEDFGKVRFEITSNGKKVYQLNEQQSTLLLTYMRNNDVVRKFKRRLVREFYHAIEELNKRKITRQKGIEARNRLTDSIRDYIPESPNKKFKYKHYTDLAYKPILGETAKQFRERNALSKQANIKDYIEESKLMKIEAIENEISVLIGMGFNYQQIKDLVTNKYEQPQRIAH